MILSLIFYNLTMLFCIYLCSRPREKNAKKSILLAYFILAFISVIRFDIGSDYESYWITFDEFSQFSIKELNYTNLALFYSIKEPVTFLAILIFSHFPGAPIWIFGVYSCLTIYFIYKTIEYWSPNSHALSIFILFISYLIFETWDWVRQGLAMSLLLYSLTFLDKKNNKNFIICLICAFFSHFSSMVFGLVYFIKDIKLNRNVLLTIIVTSYILGVTGVFGQLFGQLFSMLPIYAEAYADNSRFTDAENTNFNSLGFLCLAIWYGVLTYQLYKKNYFFGNIMFVGALLTMMSGNNLLISRIAWYFTSFQIVAVPIVLNQAKLKQISKLLMYVLIIVMFVRFNKSLLYKTGIRGCSPYETVFSDDYSNHSFRFREYRLNY